MQFKTKAEQIAHGLIQSYIGPDHKVIDMPSFFGALVQALADTPPRSSLMDDAKAPTRTICAVYPRITEACHTGV